MKVKGDRLNIYQWIILFDLVSYPEIPRLAGAILGPFAPFSLYFNIMDV